MPKNNMDQAPKIRSTGQKEPKILSQGRNAWGKAIRPHELETIFNNCIDSRLVVQLKLMMFLTGNAEDKFDVSLDTVMNRCNISKTAYYDNRKKLVERGWLSVTDDGDKSYIIIHYDKIYAEGAKYIGLKEGTSKNNTDECISDNTTDIQKEGYSQNNSHESMSQYTTDECTSENNTQKECTSEFTTESTSQYTNESTSHWSQYNIINNKNNNIQQKSEEELRAEFDVAWKNGGNSGGNSHLTGAAAMF